MTGQPSRSISDRTPEALYTQIEQVLVKLVFNTYATSAEPVRAGAFAQDRQRPLCSLTQYREPEFYMRQRIPMPSQLGRPKCLVHEWIVIFKE